MQFPIINLKNTLGEHSRDETITNFKSLDPSTLISLKDANSYYEKIPSIFIGLSGKSLEEHRNDLVLCVEEGEAGDFHGNSKLYQDDINKQKMHRWYLEQNKILQGDEFWKKLSNACKNQRQLDRLNKLKTEWSQQARFSYYTTRALIEIAEELIPVFEHYHSLLSTELSIYKDKLPRNLIKQIESYLDLLSRAIFKEKHELSQAMLSRLMVASDSKDIQKDDVTIHLAARLKELGLLQEHHSIPQSYRRGLNGTSFNYLQRYIANNGTSRQVSTLATLVWNKADENYNLIKYKNRQIPVPTEFKVYLHNKSFLQVVFNIAGANKKYLNQNVDLLCQIRFLPNPKDDFRSLFTFHENQKWQALIKLSADVKARFDICESKKPKGLLGRMLLADRLKFLNVWQDYLVQSEGSILNSMLGYASYVTTQLQTRLSLSLDQEKLCSKSFLNNLKKFNGELIEVINQLNLSCDSLPEYQTFYHEYQKVITLPEELEKAKNKRIEEERSQIQSIDEFIEWSKTNSNNAAQNLKCQTTSVIEKNPFQPIHDDYPLNEFKILLPALITKTTHLDLHNNKFPKTLDHLSEMLDVFNEIHLLQIDSELTAIFEQLFKAYLNTWIDTNEEDTALRISQLSEFEVIINKLAPDFIGERIANLIELRNSENWFTFQSKCYGLLASLEGPHFDQDSYFQKLVKMIPSEKLDLEKSISKSCHYQYVKAATFFNNKSIAPNRIGLSQEACHLVF